MKKIELAKINILLGLPELIDPLLREYQGNGNDSKLVFYENIGAGVHFTQMKDLWKRIFLSSELEFIIICTTQSKEMLDALHDVLLMEAFAKYQDAFHCITLDFHVINGSVIPQTRTFMGFHYAMESSRNIRGGDI